jgi:DNA-3-methyladenine glycosylase I
MICRPRCPWCGTDPLYVAYHDLEWGVPSYDDRHLFEMLVLEGAQAGLSWLTILRKRANYRAAFADFVADRVAAFGPADVGRLMQDPGIVRNRLKIEAAIANARAVVHITEQHGSLSQFLWQFVGGEPLINQPLSLGDLPAQSRESLAMSKELKARGCNFVGPTICYAFMQAVGMVDDHVAGCWRRCG